MYNLYAPLLSVSDPRRDHKKLYPLDYLLLVVFTASLSGCQSWYDIEDYAKDWSEDLKSLYHKLTGETLEHYTPCDDTLNRAISLLDVDSFENAYCSWLEEFLVCISGEHLCIDGKTMGGGVKKLSFDSACHTISAYSPRALAIVAQVYINGKESEIGGVKLLLEKLNLEESIVSIDAIGTQVELAQDIIDRGGDYVLPAKSNQKHSLQEIESLFCPLYRNHLIVDEQVELGHGRIETRVVESLLHPLDLEPSKILSRWAKLSSVHKVTRIREDKKTGKKSQEVAYYISSEVDLARIRAVIREHWAIENKLHYMLDVYLSQDMSSKRQGHVAQIMDIIMKVNLFIMQRLRERKKSSVPRIQKFLARLNLKLITQLEI